MVSSRSWGALRFAAFTVLILNAATGRASAESVLRVAMTAADIPDYTGAPDQGYEGYRFAGYTLYDGLALWDLSSSDKAADIMPGLATSWSVDPNNDKRWVYKLRQGVTYHDGCPWNADSALWNFKRVMDPKAPQFNPRHVGQMGTYVVNIASVDKIDDSTIAINTKVPSSLFPYEMAMFYMISNCAVEKAGNDYNAYMQHPSGTGPYKFDKVVPHERLELVKNDKYWNPQRIPKHDRLVLLPMPEASTRAAALLSGQVDFVEAPSPDTIPRLKEAGMKIVTVPYPHNWDYMLRMDVPPFNDIRVRQAANYAMNRQDMVDMLQGVAVAATQTLIDTQPWYGKPVTYDYNPDKAKALLKEAGCDPCVIKVGISTSGSGQMQPLPMNELVKEQLEAVGFKVQLEPMDWNALIGVFLTGAKKYDYNAINFSMAPIDPVQGILKKWMTTYAPPACCNWGFFSDPKVDQLGNEALGEFDAAKRNVILTKMNEQAVADASELYIVHDLNPRALSPKLSGFVQAQSWFQDLTPIVVSP
ncbi:ABC transporter substrate-binding protein [Lichenifustis flavocetrariae]|uniref:ABC transporter substrate-binding protein n=1 Tax=Lichenifustis flavocetrariae TaxID=2949735 RepID=A0AA42CHE3_9HYPH|nr:ABC transporter substrate-binding protein [Lichenifustis flavocetrariae]MCW6507458.1 ABC transporter substrate-binding protein [Lichenifustis flavocetrariae]